MPLKSVNGCLTNMDFTIFARLIIINMLSLFYKEIAGFFSSLTGYIAIVVYLLANSLLLWVFPGYLNIAESGYATLEPLFIISPWVFMFLVPAVTMRMFSDEKRQGTLDLLFTRPISEIQIVLAKYFASVVLVILSLIPTLVFWASVYYLGNPSGNMDMGATLGSYIGLFFLAAIYAAIGLFASSLTENQIVAFILAVIVSLLFYAGFNALSAIPVIANDWLAPFGIDWHYKSISRGIIDSRNIFYFVATSAIFILITRTVLQSRKW